MKSKVKYVAMVLIFGLAMPFLSGCSTAVPSATEAKNLSATVEYKHMEGVDPNLLSLDIYYSSLTGPKKPVVIYIHGGAWCIGDKAREIDNKIRFFQSLNYVFVSINYRLSPYPYKLESADRIMYPMHSRDVADALKWVWDNIGSYGGDSNKIALLGHSAGAHLAALTGTDPQFLSGVGLSFSNIRGIAVIDTEGYDVAVKVEEGSKPYINAFGNDRGRNIQASLLHNLKKDVSYPRFFIVKRGSRNRIEAADNFINTLQRNGVFVSQLDASVYSHSEVNKAIGRPGETLMTNALKHFFEECFK